MLLAGDIGGTKTELAIYSADTGPREALATAAYPSAEYPSLEAIVREFLTTSPHTVEAACFDVAGPVIAGQVKVTNLPWVVDASSMAAGLGLQAVWLLNDLEAIARAVPVLQPDDLSTLQAGTALPGGALAVVAPGTGLGEAYLTWDGTRYIAHPSEGGHADFAPVSTLQFGLLEYLAGRFDHVSVERVASGSGIPNLYDYLRDSGYAPELPAIAAQLAATADRTPIIRVAAVETDPPDPLCRATLELFVATLAAEVGNMALKVLATGGIYLGGGIPPRILPLLQGEIFRQSFLHKGRFNELLARMPIWVITRQAAILGAAHYGLERLAGGPAA